MDRRSAKWSGCLIALGLAGLQGCGGGGGGGGGGAAFPVAAPAPVPAPAPQSLVGGSLFVGNCHSTATEVLNYLKVNINQYLGSPIADACNVPGVPVQQDKPLVMIDFVAFDAQGAPIDMDLTQDSFSEVASATGPAQAYFFRSGFKLPAAPTGSSYSAFLAFDQSASILQTDPTDTRIAAGQLFLKRNAAPDEVGVGTFQGDRVIRKFDVPNANGVFTPDGAGLASSLDSLKNAEAGDTPLYDAAAIFSELTAQKATASEKAVVIFSDGKDTSSQRTLAQAVQAAVDHKVRISTFALDGPGQDLPALQSLAYETGGVFLYASNAQQIVAMYGSLGHLLRKNHPIYRTFWQLQIDPATAPACFTKQATEPGIHSCAVPANIRVKTPRGDVHVVVNYTYRFRVL